MSIWQYSHSHDYSMQAALATQDKCMYCQTPMLRDREDEEKVETFFFLNYGMSDKFTTNAWANIAVCPCCGWWRYVQGTDVGGRGSYYYDVRVALLKALDDVDSMPIDEIREYLIAKYESRFEVDPRKFEEVVADVFRNLGHEVILTSYSGDNGIDVILNGPAGGTVGIQVKRYRNSIKVDKIRELTGALVIGGHTKGIFVTTSVFQAGAARVADLSSIRGYPIELVDGERFYAYLKIARIASPEQITVNKPWGQVWQW